MRSHRLELVIWWAWVALAAVAGLVCWLLWPAVAWPAVPLGVIVTLAVTAPVAIILHRRLLLRAQQP